MTKLAYLMIALTGIVTLSAGTGTSDGGETPIPIDPESGKYRHREVVEVQGASADELLNRARSWVAASYQPGKYVTKLDDEGSHTLVIKGTTDVPRTTDQASVQYTLTLETEDGRYRCTIGDFTVSTLPSEYGPGLKGYELERVNPKKPIVKQTAEAMDALVADLAAAMATPNAPGAPTVGP